jgi:hypothetical protein
MEKGGEIGVVGQGWGKGGGGRGGGERSRVCENRLRILLVKA